MSKKASKSLIGAFVIGAIALIIAGVVIFGSGKLFAPVKKFVMVFEGSVKGLNVGSAVTFRGVKIGVVTDIQLRVNPKDLTAVIPVYVEIDPRKITVPEEYKSLVKGTKYAFINPLIEKGLKAQLQTQSFVTGQLVVNVDFYPDKPTKLADVDKKYPEIPTIPSTSQEIVKRLEELPINEIADNLKDTLAGMKKIVNSPELTGSIASLHQTLKDTDKLVVNLDGRVGPLVTDLRSTLDAARVTLANIEKAFSMKEGVPAQLGETMKKADTALEQAEKTLATIQVTAHDTSSVGYEFKRTLKELSDALRSIRFLADYLDRHPESLLRGKPDSGGE